MQPSIWPYLSLGFKSVKCKTQKFKVILVKLGGGVRPWLRNHGNLPLKFRGVLAMITIDYERGEGGKNAEKLIT